MLGNSLEENNHDMVDVSSESYKDENVARTVLDLLSVPITAVNINASVSTGTIQNGTASTIDNADTDAITKDKPRVVYMQSSLWGFHVITLPSMFPY